MKALLTAGGRATRLRPITHTINKHLIPLANKPMIVHAIEKIRDAGIIEIAININLGELEIQQCLGDGSDFGVHITYIEQAGGPKGIAHAIQNAKTWLGDAPFLFYLGDNIIRASILEMRELFDQEHLDCLLALSRVQDPQRFGVPELDGERIVRVVEKPQNPPSDFAVTGIYFFRSSMFEAVSHIAPSARGEYEISDGISWLIDHGYNVGWKEITGWWKDTGKPEDLLAGNRFLLEEMNSKEIHPEAIIEEDVIIDGPVLVGAGTRIKKGSVIRGPMTIGENCIIANSTIGPHVCLQHNVQIQETQIENSIVLEGSTIDEAGRIVNSIFGKMVQVQPKRISRGGGKRFLIGDNALVEL